MRTYYWKLTTIALGGVLFWLACSGHSVTAQSISNEQTYNITRTTAASGTVSLSVPGAVIGFSCVPDVRGDLDQGSGLIESASECYVLSK